MKLFNRNLLPILLLLATPHVLADGVVVIGHPSLQKLDAVTLQKIYTGKIIEVNGNAISAVNLISGNASRSQFLAAYLGQDEEKYQAYWTVRKFIGKGSPPKELASSAEVIEFVQSQAGAIGYIDVGALKQGLNVLNRR